MPFVPFDFVILPPGHNFWSLPIFAYYSALQYVVQGNLWIFWLNKEPFWLFKFPWTISEGSIKNSFFNPLEKVLKNWTKKGSLLNQKWF